MGRIRKKQVDKVICPFVSEDNILCTDTWRSYTTFAKEKGIDHYRLKSGEQYVLKGIYHIQNVNNYHQRFKKWLNRFHGVSSKYLDNYLAWFHFLDMKGFEETQANP